MELALRPLPMLSQFGWYLMPNNVKCVQFPHVLAGALFTKENFADFESLKQLHLCRLCTSTSHSEMKLSIDRADRHQAMLRCQRPIDIVVKKESPSLHRSSFGNLPSKKNVMVKKIFHHFHQLNNLKSLFGWLT